MRNEALSALPDCTRIDAADSGILFLADAAEPCRVLVVDDDELILSRLSSLLERSGFEVHTARSGDEALRVMDSTFCQIVLTDWRMPNMDGLALCRNLRLRKIEGYIYVLMLTVCNGRSDILAGLSAGADDYVVKGATAEEILARLDVGRRITYLERSLRKSNRENRRMSVTDPLTGSRNRRFLMKYLPRELERSRRYNHPIAILSCDIDHFKRVNDSLGHEAGDEILQEFVRRVDNCIRTPIDWIARSGGEEFVVVLPETTLLGASRVAAMLRDILAVQPMPTSAGPLAITVSIGVIALETNAERNVVHAADLLRAADRCLYQSKRLGRDRATAASLHCEGITAHA